MIALPDERPARRTRIVTMRPPLGRLIQQYLDRAGLSQSDAARRAGIDHSTVSRIIKGARNPTPELLDLLAPALDLADDERDELVVLAGYIPGRYIDHVRALISLDPEDRATVRSLVDRLRR